MEKATFRIQVPSGCREDKGGDVDGTVQLLTASFIEKLGTLEVTATKGEMFNDSEGNFVNTNISVHLNPQMQSTEWMTKVAEFLQTHVHKPTISVVVHETSLFASNLQNKYDYAIRNFSFGNTINSQFICHYRSSQNTPRAWFEFDVHDLLFVKWSTVEDSPEMDFMPEHHIFDIYDYTPYRNWDIKIRRSNVRKLIVDVGKNAVDIYFELNNPPPIRISPKAKDRKNDPKRKYRTSSIGQAAAQAFADSHVFAISLASSSMDHGQLYALLSQLRSCCHVEVEFRQMNDAFHFIKKNAQPYFQWARKNTQRRGNYCTDMLEDSSEYVTFKTKLDRLALRKHPNRSKDNDMAQQKYFGVLYLIEAILARTGTTKYLLLTNSEKWNNFLNTILDMFVKNDLACEFAMESVIKKIDERVCIVDMAETLSREFDGYKNAVGRNEAAKHLSPYEISLGLVRVRKVILTPTRIIPCVPETIMGNRALRAGKINEDGTAGDGGSDTTRIVRVIFRDDDMLKMSPMRMRTDKIDEVLEKYFTKGFTIAGREFGHLGSSSSQLRDHGAYFLEKYNRNDRLNFERGIPYPEIGSKIVNKRKELGNFEKCKNISQWMARLGQCFTQTREGAELPAENVIEIPDVLGGCDPWGNDYNFTDGVGIISYGFAEQVMRTMFGANNKYRVPSGFQIRFQGFKGMLCLHVDMKKLGIPATVYCAFRNSQKKFEAKDKIIEIVKYSTPTSVALNRPLINLLDQVSEKQSTRCHSRIWSRVLQLLDDDLQLCAQALLDDDLALGRLKSQPCRFSWSDVQNAKISPIREPFLRSLVYADAKLSIARLLKKSKISIPFDTGRSFLGVSDETKTLKYGQVFVQYTKSTRYRLPTKEDQQIVVNGTVLITKNPCINSGDVRVFEAVDVPELRHLCDVVVFPQKGHRPHPDEMAGSDLDGDEYTVIWDKQLLLERNEPAANFNNVKTAVRVNDATLDIEMAKSFSNYVKLDAVGTLSINHLLQSDQYGIDSTVCKLLAEKIDIALNFSKNGTPAKKMEMKWKKDENGEEIPPERAERHPDYHHTNGAEFVPVYKSMGLVGVTHRIVKQLESVVLKAPRVKRNVPLDPLIVGKNDDWKQFEDEAQVQYSAYKARLKHIMDFYGLKTEAEIFSGCWVDIINRQNEKDNEDRSYFNTDQTIRSKMTGLFSEFREQFFEEFGGFQAITKATKKASELGIEGILSRRCKDMDNTKIQAKARAFYRVCYEGAEMETKQENQCLSFAWLASDVLCYIRTQNLLAMNDANAVERGARGLDVQPEPLEQFIDESSKEFCLKDDFIENCKAVRSQSELIQSYVDAYEGISQLLSMVNIWVERVGHKAIATFACNAFIYFATTHKPRMSAIAFLAKDADGSFKIERPAQALLEFFAFLTLQRTSELGEVCVADASGKGTTLYLYCIGRLRKPAINTYYEMVFNNRFFLDDTIPALTISQQEPFTVELTSFSSESTIAMLKAETGIEHLLMRKLKCDHRINGLYRVMCRGTEKQYRDLRTLLMPVYAKKLRRESPEDRSYELARQVSLRINRLQ